MPCHATLTAISLKGFLQCYSLPIDSPCMRASLFARLLAVLGAYPTPNLPAFSAPPVSHHC